MSVLISPQTNHTRPIIISRPEEKLDPDALGDQLADLSRRRRITCRDERLLEHLLAAGVLTLDQIRRLLWPEAAPKTAADRLSKLWGWHLLRRARSPWPDFRSPHLVEGTIFGLGQGGWWWLCQPEPDDYAYRLIDAEWVWRQLPAAEIYTRLAVTGAAFDWQPRWRELPEPFRAGYFTALGFCDLVFPEDSQLLRWGTGDRPEHPGGQALSAPEAAQVLSWLRSGGGE